MGKTVALEQEMEGGEARSAEMSKSQEKRSGGGVVGTFPLLITMVLLGLSVLVPEMALGDTTIFKGKTPENKYIGTMIAFNIPASYFFLHWAFFHVASSIGSTVMKIQKTSLRNIEEDANAGLCRSKMETWRDSVFQLDWTAFILSVVVGLASLKLIANSAVKEDHLPLVRNILNLAIGCALFVGWASFLDRLNQMAHDYADEVEQVLRNNKKTSKWTTILAYFSSFQDPETDTVYGIPGGVHTTRGAKSPARVLADIVGIYVLLGDTLGFCLLLLMFIGVDLYENIVVIGFSVLFTVVITALHLGDAIGGIVPLVISNSFHVGEIVSFTRPGLTPGDNPRTHLTGFVEGITWGHCVIRDFRRKQVHIPIGELRNVVVSNWTRRPTKACYFTITVEAGLVDAAIPLSQLASFLKDWLAAHPGVDQNSYVKSVASLKASGQQLEVVFYPILKYDVYKLRSEFLVVVSNAAKRLGVCILPVEVRVPYGSQAHGGRDTSFPSPWENDEKSAESKVNSCDFKSTIVNLMSDLMPSDQLAEQAGFPKKKDD